MWEGGWEGKGVGGRIYSAQGQGSEAAATEVERHHAKGGQRREHADVGREVVWCGVW